MYDICKAPVLALYEPCFAIPIAIKKIKTQSPRAGRGSAVSVVLRFRYVNGGMPVLMRDVLCRFVSETHGVVVFLGGALEVRR